MTQVAKAGVNDGRDEEGADEKLQVRAESEG